MSIKDYWLNYETEEVDEFQSVRADETSTLNISERTNQNSADIVPDSTKNSNAVVFYLSTLPLLRGIQLT